MIVCLRAISAEVARQVQGSGDDDEGALALEELPDEADRALACVRQKLDTKLSVEYTVNQLILDATSPENLGRIFAGKYFHLFLSYFLVLMPLHIQQAGKPTYEYSYSTGLTPICLYTFTSLYPKLLAICNCRNFSLAVNWI